MQIVILRRLVGPPTCCAWLPVISWPATVWCLRSSGNALEVLSCLLVFGIARKVFASDLVGLVAAAMYAFYPPFMLCTAELITETFTIFVVLAAFAAFLSFVSTRRARDLVLAGVAIALGALNKPQLLPMAVVLPVAALSDLGWRQAARSAALILIVISLVMAPWMARNALVLHAFVPGVTHGGIAFWGGTAPIDNRIVGALGDPWVPDSLRQTVGRLSEVEQSRWLFHDGLRIVAADPWRYARLCFPKVFELWLNVGYGTPPSKASWALAIANLGALALAILAVLKANPLPYAVRAMGLLWVYWTVVNILVSTVVRYSMPYYALLFCFSAAGVVYVVDRARGGAERAGAMARAAGRWRSPRP